MGMTRSPYNEVASFVYRYSKGDRQKKILEVGSGDGNNLWFLAKEGFEVCGIEINTERIENSKTRFKEDNLKVEIKEGSFTEIDYDNESFDLVIDRGSVTCVSLEDAKKAVNEIHRVLKKDGYFYFNPYSEEDGNFTRFGFIEDGRTKVMQKDFDYYQGIHYYSVKEVFSLFDSSKWEIVEFNSSVKREVISRKGIQVGLFEVIVKKI